MDINIIYDKNKVLHALRYHFLSRPEIKILLIIVNIFAVISACLMYFKKITPIAFLLSSFLWIVLMISFWFILPWLVYKKSKTFKEEILLSFLDNGIQLKINQGVAQWEYRKFKYYTESTNFFHLYMDERTFFLVPKDACMQADLDNGLSEVRQILDNKIGKK